MTAKFGFGTIVKVKGLQCMVLSSRLYQGGYWYRVVHPTDPWRNALEFAEADLEPMVFGPLGEANLDSLRTWYWKCYHARQ